MEKKIYVSTEFICNILSTGAMLAETQKPVSDSTITKCITQLIRHYSNEEGTEVAACCDLKRVIMHAIDLYRLHNQSE